MVLGDYIVRDFKLIPPKESLNEVSPIYCNFTILRANQKIGT